MEIPTGSFFEVTINSNKLYSFIDDIFKLIHTQQGKLEEFHKTFNNVTGSLAQRLKKQENEMQYEIEKIKRMSQEQANYLNLYIKDADKKNGEKLQEMENNITSLNQKLYKIQHESEEDVNYKIAFLQKKINYLPTINDINTNFDVIITSRMQQLNQQIKQQQQNISILEQQIKTNHLEPNIIEKLEELDKSRIKSKKNSIMLNETSKQIKEKKKKKKYEQVEQSQDYLHIIDKMQGLEHQLIVQRQKSERRVMLSNTQILKATENYNSKPVKSPFGRSERPKKQIQSLITSKLESIETIACQKISLLEKQIGKITNKNEIIDEHIGILSRKIEKQKNKFNEIITLVKKCEDKKIDEKAIENLKNLINKMSKEIQQHLETKLNKEIFDKERSRVSDKLNLLSDLLLQRAEKTEVKKGFTFLEDKIKQIIIVIAEEQNQNKDGAIKRTPFKCLSCDKQLENKPSQGVFKAKDNTQSIRCTTTQMRKRIRMVNNPINSNDD